MTNHDCFYPLLFCNQCSQCSTYGSHPPTTDTCNISIQSCQQSRTVLYTERALLKAYLPFPPSNHKRDFGATCHLLVTSTPMIIPFREQHEVLSITRLFDLNTKIRCFKPPGGGGAISFNEPKRSPNTIRDSPGTNDITMSPLGNSTHVANEKPQNSTMRNEN